jgi:hypothetical protein
MAREKVQLDAKSAREIANQLCERLKDYSARERDMVYGHDRFSEELRAIEELGRIGEKLKDLVGWRADEPKEGWEAAVQDLREWILKHMNDEGWKRLLAARRKAKQQRADKHSSYDKRKSQILTTDKAAHQLKLMSEEYELDRSEFVARFAMWLTYAENGQAAVRRFAEDEKLKKKPEAGGRAKP